MRGGRASHGGDSRDRISVVGVILGFLWRVIFEELDELAD